MEKLKELNKKTKIIIGVISVLVILIIGTMIYYFNGISAVTSKSEPVIVSIPNNTTGNEVINILDNKGLLKSKTAAKLYLKLHSSSFKSNSYRLNRNMSLEKIFTILNENNSKYIANVKITVIDGTTIPTYASKISKATGIKESEILTKWEDKTYLNKLIKDYWFLTDDILNDDIYFPLEGYLAPNTYIFTTNEASIDNITRSMLDQTKKELDPYKKQIENFKINNQNVSIHDFLSLCAVVQRESPTNNKDRKLIAGVLMNRLNKPMKLQCDVTVNYSNQVTKIAVTYKDLKTDSKYNTYLYDGVPVGPISSIDSNIYKDVLNYSSSDYYFFFAKKDGSILYSKTADEHNKKVAENKWY
ncbi:MAG: endolytic transglycosylase MltG [Thomasclavelia sp.]|nr:endolytic transglycosylase MltG [Thomasclavelia sp.]